jgi:uncharacterized membrane protein
MTAAAAALVAVAFYWRGHDRPFGTDEWLTVREYVRAPGLLDAFRAALVWNNHPLFSFLERLVAAAIGSSTPTAMRVLPVGFSGLAVGSFCYIAVRRFGAGLGAVATAFFAANPLWGHLAVQVRGYSLLVLLTIVATSILFALRTRQSMTLEAAYIVAMGLAIATHLYAVLVLLGHVAFITDTWTDRTRWVFCWCAAVSIGLLAYVAQLSQLPFGDRGREFNPTFPLRVSRELLGHNLVVVTLAGALVATALVNACATRAGRRVTLAYIGAFIAVWVAGSVDLYTRFFVWAVPVTAWGVAAGLDAITEQHRQSRRPG